jgi:hypothetical protein
MMTTLWNRFKNRLFVSMLPQQREFIAPLMQRAMADNPQLAETLLRSNETIWGTAIQTFMMQRFGDIDANGLPSQTTRQYPVLNQLGYGGRHGLAKSLPKVSPFNLRQFSEYTPVRRAINAIVNPILDMPWSIEPVKSAFQSGNRHQDLSLSEEAQVLIAQNVLTNPNNDDSWRNLIWQVLEDILVGGFGSIEVQRTDNVFRPVVLYPVDGSSIRVNAEWKGGEESRYAQGVGFLGQGAIDQQVIQLRDDELLYFRIQPRTNTPFGLGYVETAYRNINAWVGAVEYAERRASNTTPNFALHLGENIDPATVRVWRQYWENEVEGYGKVPIIGGGRQPEVLNFTQGSEDELWLKWQELLIRYIAQAFNLTSSTFALEKDVNRSTAGQMDADDWGAVAPIAHTISDLITHKLIHRILGFRNLRFRWVIRDSDEMRQSEILEKRYNMNSITPNEIREHYDQPPLEDDMGNMIQSQLSGIEDALPAMAPGLREQQNPTRQQNPFRSMAASRDEGDDNDYVLDRIERLIKRNSQRDDVLS